MYQVELSVAEFPQQADEPILDTSIGDILRSRALATPHQLAVAEAIPGAPADVRMRSLTYAELLSESEALAGALQSRFGVGERVAIWAPNCLEWVTLEFACALAGLTFVTVNPSSQARELDYVLRQSNAAALFTVQNYRGNPLWRIATEVVPGLPHIRKLIDMEMRDQLFGGESAANRLAAVAPSDPAMIIYTSGTTGNPKGVILSHRGVTNNSRLAFKRIHSSPGSAVVTAGPLFHVGGCVVSLLGSVQHGYPLILLKSFDPGMVLDLIEAYRAGLFFGVPTMLHGVLDQQEASPRHVTSLVTILSGAAMVAPELIRRTREILGCGVQNLYGQTECSGVLTQTYFGDEVVDVAGTVGQALPNVAISIRSLVDNGVLAPGQIGEICARGFGEMLGYNDDPEATTRTIDSDGWLHTGDLGSMDSRGYLRITGRVKEMIIRGGENIYPAEIENVLLEHPHVSEVAVVGIPDTRWGEIICCFLRSPEGIVIDEAELVRHCRSTMAPQKTPTRWVTVDDWPLTGSGKIQKFTLRDKFLAGDYG